MKTGERLKCFLDERGIKQTAVAAAIGMDIKTFNAILNGRIELKADTLIDVLKFTGTPPNKFFTKQFLETRSTA